eukprot:PITA_02027
MGVTDEEWKKLDRKAKRKIRLCVSDSVLLNVAGEATVKALWDKLGTLYQSKSLVNKLFLWKNLYNLRMKDGDLVTQHLNVFNTVFDEIVSALLTEEMRRKNMDSQNGNALSVRGRSQNRNKNKSSSGRSKSRGRSKSPGKPTKVVCWKCGKEGHFRRECKSKAPDKGKGSDDAPSAEAKTTSDEGVKTVFEKDTCKMVRGALVLMRGVRIGTLSKLQGSTVVDGGNSSMVPENGAENLVVSGEKTMLWHQRLGHIGEKGLQILHGKGMVEGMSNSSLDFDFCENCVYGKQNRMTSQGIHGYISLRRNLKSLIGLKNLSLWWKSDREEDKVLRTDNGGEFCSKEFEEFCKKCGIARQKTTLYTPQQNGVTERMNKTLMDRARSMLSGVELGHEFWAEAVDTTCYLVNSSPS